MILTRFSRVTFNAAHKYLGLTAEVLRTEKAINDIACHPLPPSFYEGGGLQYLRQRFDGASSNTSESDSDYFSFTQSQHTQSPISTSKPASVSASSSTASLGKISDNPIPLKPAFYKGLSRTGSTNSSRHMVQAGDLLIAHGSFSDYPRYMSRAYSISNTPRILSSSIDDIDQGKKMKVQKPTRWSADDFDLREEVMSCIAKSIGLLQPPLSHGDSESPKSPPSEYRNKTTTSAFDSPFGSLSLLDIGDDTSSTAGASTASMSNNLSGLDNEVEILFYAAGTTWQRQERSTQV